MQQGETAGILREKGNFLLLCWPFQKLLLFQEKWVGDLWLALYLLQRANLELTRNECRLFCQRNEIVKVYLADFIPLSTFVFEGRECFPTCGVFSYSYCTLKVTIKFTLISLERHLVWNGLCMFVCMFSFFTSWYKILQQKKSSKLFQRTSAVRRTSTKSPLFHRNSQTCGKPLLIFFFPPERCYEALWHLQSRWDAILLLHLIDRALLTLSMHPASESVGSGVLESTFSSSATCLTHLVPGEEWEW